MFLIYNQKYCYASLLNKRYEVFVRARAATSYKFYVNKYKPKYT